MKSVQRKAKKTAGTRRRQTRTRRVPPVPPVHAPVDGADQDVSTVVLTSTWDPSLPKWFGIASIAGTKRLVEQMADVLVRTKHKDHVDLLNTIVDLMVEAKPRGVVESMLAVQLLTTHHVIARSLASAATLAFDLADRERHAKRAAALQAGFAALAETWSRLRAESRPDATSEGH